MLVFSVLYVVLIFIPFIACDDGNGCKTITPCSCMFPNGTGIDLNPAKFHQVSTFKDSSVDTHKQLRFDSYYYFPCKDGKVNITDHPLGSDNSCDKPLALCRREHELDMTPDAKSQLFNITTKILRYRTYGSNEHVTFSYDGAAIIYENEPSRSTVKLECSPTSQYDSMVVDDSEPDNVVFRLYSKNACFRQLKEISTRSTGTTLVIIVLTVSLVYLVLGVLVKRCMSGARGIEVIPNITFWRDLPSLCRDGWEFARSGFNTSRPPVGPASPNPSNYDSI